MPLNFLERPVDFHNTNEGFSHNKREGGRDFGAEWKEVARVKRRGADASLT